MIHEQNASYFPPQETVGKEEIEAANTVLKSGILSHFRGNATDRFYGGPKIREFEEKFADYVKSKYAISVNSCTSALNIACHAIGLAKGESVIVSPWSMSCSASAPLATGAKVDFADINISTFNVEKTTVATAFERSVNSGNVVKSVIAVGLFGHPINPELRALANKFHFTLIEDAAQSIGASVGSMMAGTIGHIGCFSFTQGKHITAGEGGMIVTDNDEIASRCRLIRNHAEAVVHDTIRTLNVNNSPCSFTPDALQSKLVGQNFRMTELQAAILIEQLKKLPRFISERQERADRLNDVFNTYSEFVSVPYEAVGASHSYYAYALKWNMTAYGAQGAQEFVNALNDQIPKEYGRPDKNQFSAGYVDPLYKIPLFKRTNLSLPNVEALSENVIVSTIVGQPLTDRHFDTIRVAVNKAFETLAKGGSNV